MCDRLNEIDTGRGALDNWGMEMRRICLRRLPLPACLALLLCTLLVEAIETCTSQVLVCGTHKKRDSRLHATQVSCGGSMTMAIGDDKKVMCWGVIDRGPFASSET